MSPKKPVKKTSSFHSKLNKKGLPTSQVNALFAQGRHLEALHFAEQGLTCEPNDAVLLKIAAGCSHALGMRVESEHFLRRFLSVNPKDAKMQCNLGNLLQDRQCFDEADACYRKALSANPNYPEAYNDLGYLLKQLMRFDEAEDCFRKALAIKPNYAKAIYNLAVLLLYLGKFDEGWRLYEVRFDSALANQPSFVRNLSFPCWRGESLVGKSILIWPEQGFGDEIQFCRYVPLLKKQGALRITLVCKESLKPLLMTLEGVDEVLTREEKSVIKAHDFWSFQMSLPWFCKTTLNSIPVDLPYLHAVSPRVEQWAARFPREGLRVGLAWRGRGTHINDAHRSLPSLTVLAPLWDIHGIRLISLQKGQGEEEAMRPPPGQPILHFGSEIRDFADTAAIVSRLDLVICVDTAIAHLAGALGKPCWVLLPRVRTDWRWLHERSDSPWYPGVMRLFRQKAPDDWTSIVQDVADELKLLVLRYESTGSG